MIKIMHAFDCYRTAILLLFPADEKLEKSFNNQRLMVSVTKCQFLRIFLSFKTPDRFVWQFLEKRMMKISLNFY